MCLSCRQQSANIGVDEASWQRPTGVLYDAGGDQHRQQAFALGPILDENFVRRLPEIGQADGGHTPLLASLMMKQDNGILRRGWVTPKNNVEGFAQESDRWSRYLSEVHVRLV